MAENSGWRPIEEAPRDGSRFDGWDGRRAERIADVYWYTPPANTYGWAQDSYPAGGKFAPGWAVEWNDMIFHVPDLTHWMPLPAPPDA